MDALVWTGPRKMEMQDAPEPRRGEGEVILRVGAAGICGSEIIGYLGKNALRKPPLIMGHEAAGTVLEGTDRLPKGTPVAFNPLIVCKTCDSCRAGRTNLCRNRRLIGAHRPGAYAQRVAVPEAQCHVMPKGLSHTAGALAEPLACGVRAASHAACGPDQKLLILGAGLIGLSCLAAARGAGVKTVAMSDIDPRRLEVAKAWGVTETIDARQDVPGTVNEIFPGGADVVIDAVGAGVTRNQSFTCVVPGGRVIYMGLHEEVSSFDAGVAVRQEVVIIGSFAYTDAEYGKALDLLGEGLIKPDPSWLQERPLGDGAAAFAELADATSSATKIILTLPE